MDNPGKITPAVVGTLLGVAVAIGVARFAAGAQTPYQCPICGAQFATYDELYQHFTTEHPSEPIDIIWT